MAEEGREETIILGWWVEKGEMLCQRCRTAATRVGKGGEGTREKAPPLDSFHSIGGRVNIREEGLAEEHLGKTNPGQCHRKGTPSFFAFPETLLCEDPELLL